jgi:hypothetical protein
LAGIYGLAALAACSTESPDDGYGRNCADRKIKNGDLVVTE